MCHNESPAFALLISRASRPCFCGSLLASVSTRTAHTAKAAARGVLVAQEESKAN